jgi:cytochrome c oxidase cbb3-type subunit 3
MKSFPTIFSRALPLAVIMLVGGCDLPGKPKPADRPVSPRDVTDFALLFQSNCSGCHGADGELGPAPPLNDPQFLAIVPDDVLLKTVREGRHGTPMPGFAPKAGGPLTDEQVRILATGLKHLWQTPESLTVVGVPSPAYIGADGNAERGRAIFAKACAGCHGEQGKGGPHAGAIHDPALLSLMSDRAIRRIIITGRSDLGMPGFGDNDGRGLAFQPLTSTEIDDLVALLAGWRKEIGVNPTPATHSN